MKNLILVVILILSPRAWSGTCEENFIDVVSQARTSCEAHNVGCDAPGQHRTASIRQELVGPLGYPPTAIALTCVWHSCDGSPDIDYHTMNAFFCDSSHLPVAIMPMPEQLQLPHMQCGSIVQTENRVIGESIPIPGSAVSLNYFTSWSKGRIADYRFSIPLSGSVPRETIVSFDVLIKTSDGRILFDQNIVNDPNQTVNILWDGLNSTGLDLVGTNKFSVSVAENRSSAINRTIIVSKPAVGNLKSDKFGLGGWLPSSFVYYDKPSKTLIYGSGRARKIRSSRQIGTQDFVPEDDGSKVFVFDENGRLATVKSPKLGSDLESWNYDGQGRLTSISYPFGKTLLFNRNSSGDFVSITSPNGVVTPVELYSTGFLKKVTPPGYGVYTLEYHSNTLLKSFQKPIGAKSEFTYDLDGNLVRDSHSGGYFFDLVKSISGGLSITKSTTTMGRETGITTYGSGANYSSVMILPGGGSFKNGVDQLPSGTTTYREEGVRVDGFYSEPDPRFGGGVDRSRGNSIGGSKGYRLVVRKESWDFPDENWGGRPPFSYVWNRVVSSVDGGTALVDIFFTKSAKLYSGASAMGRSFERGVDDYERTTKIKIGSFNPINFNYSKDKISSISTGDRTTTIAYDGSDYLSSVLNPLGQKTMYLNDAAGRVLSAAFPDGRIVGFQYDGVGNLTTVTPAHGFAHSFAVNAAELPESYFPPPLSGSSVVNTHYTYNQDKQLTSIARPDGGLISYSYDPTYGFLKTASIPGGTIYYDIDSSVNLPISIRLPSGVSTSVRYSDSESAYWSWNDVGTTPAGGYSEHYIGRRLTSDEVYTDGSERPTVSYAYNNDELLSLAGDLSLSYSFPNGTLSSTSIGSVGHEVSDSYTFSGYGELSNYSVSYSGSPLFSLALSRDKLGRVIKKIENLNGATATWDYHYDENGRLAKTNRNGLTKSFYQYDSNNNRTCGATGAQIINASYDEQDRLKTYNAFNYSYNANGELISKTNIVTSQSSSYVNDVFGNLTQVNLSNGDVVDYEIDGLNRRIGKKVNGVLQKRWVYMDATRIAAEISPVGVITKRFVYASKRNIPDYMIMGGENYRIISDHLGSVRLVVKVTDGSVIQKMEHDDFGKVMQDTNPGFVPFGFAGGLYDADTHLVKFGARDYDPEIGRWTSKDPILFSGGDTNLYGYVQNDPINWVDSEGMSKKNPGQVLENDPFAGGGGVGGSANVVATIRPNGQLIGQAGSSSRVRVVSGGLQDAQNMYGGLCKGGTLSTPSNYSGQMVRFSDGGVVGLRPASSSGPPTIDINVPGMPGVKIKFTGD